VKTLVTKRYAVVLASAALLAGGCSGQGTSESDIVSTTALAFAQAAGSAPDSACTMLAPETLQELEESEGPCADSLAGQGLPTAKQVRDVEVYGKDAMAVLDEDTIFLARFDSGWKVTAAGCTANGDKPYECSVKAG
jgi:hypothetical protein